MKKLTALLLTGITAASLLLSGCGSEENESYSISEAIPEEDTSAAETQTETPTEEEAPEGKVRSQLTNEWIDEELYDQRPIAVMYPINKEAMPQYGYDQVDIFYEILEEDGMSRQMAIMKDWKNLDKIGNIRSIRDYFVYPALEYDSIIVHFGGPIVYVKDILTRDDVQNINGVGGELGDSYDAFFRENPDGRASEHTAYTSSEKLLAACDTAGFSLTYRDDVFSDYKDQSHYRFTSASNKNTLESYDSAVDATKLDFSDAYPADTPVFEYNSDDHLYYRSIYGEPQVDGTTGTQLAFENILVQWAYYEVRDDNGYLAFQMHDNTHDGMFITEGKMIHVTWTKDSDYGPTRYYDDNGDEITLNTGKTMVCVLKDDVGFTVDGSDILPSSGN